LNKGLKATLQVASILIG